MGDLRAGLRQEMPEESVGGTADSEESTHRENSGKFGPKGSAKGRYQLFFSGPAKKAARVLNPGPVRRIAASPRWSALRLVTRTSPATALLLGLSALLSGIVPTVLIVSLGVLVGAVPAAARGGGLGARETWALTAVGCALALSFVLATWQRALAEVVKTNLTFHLQARLMTAVSTPTGVAHLEDPEVLNRIAMAEGSLLSYFPADAPAVMARIASDRLAGVGACVVVGCFRWWLGLGLLVLWVVVRRPIRRIIADDAKSLGGQASVMRRAQYFQSLATSRGAAKDLRIFGIGEWAVDHYRAHWLRGIGVVWRSRARLYRTVSLAGVAVLLCYLAAAGVIAQAVVAGEVGVGRLAMLLPALLASSGVGGVSAEDITLEWMLAGLPHLQQLEAELQERAVALPGRHTVTAPAQEIRFENVTFRYRTESEPVFDGLDLVIPAGRATAIVGANGAGKTTLVKLLGRLHDPAGGRITVDGVPLTALDAEAWQRRLAVVFQDFNTYPFTAAENVGFGAMEHLDDTEGLDRAARRAAADKVIDELPDGWNTVLSPDLTHGVDLSGGQWQRLALARALFAAEHGAAVLVLDEPTSMLDAEAEAEFYERFLDLTRGLTTLVISHRFSTVRQADVICVLQDGQVSEQGSHRELLARDGTYAAMFRSQAARFTDDNDRESEANGAEQ